MATSILSKRKTEATLSRGRFGRWTVLGHVGLDSKRNNVFMCRCDCGTERAVKGANLRNGSSQSCGCLQKERTGVAAVKTWTKHGMANSPEHICWMAMKRRCYNQNCADFRLYGGRGILVCDRWKNSFANFLSDMGIKPSSRHSIDRINNDGNYEPNNCRWALPDVQSRNTRATVFVPLGNEMIPLNDAARITGVSQEAIRKRVALGLPIDRRRPHPKHSEATKEKIRQSVTKTWPIRRAESHRE